MRAKFVQKGQKREVAVARTRRGAKRDTFILRFKNGRRITAFKLSGEAFRILRDFANELEPVDEALLAYANVLKVIEKSVDLILEAKNVRP